MKKVHPRGVLLAMFCHFFSSPVMNCSSDEEEIGSGCMFLDMSHDVRPNLCMSIRSVGTFMSEKPTFPGLLA